MPEHIITRKVVFVPLKKGDILDEKKRYAESCGLMVKVMSGGAGFEKLICCDHDLTDEDIVPQVGSALGRKRGTMPVGMILDENKLYPDSCGLRVMILEGGAGFRAERRQRTHRTPLRLSRQGRAAGLLGHLVRSLQDRDPVVPGIRAGK
jgi:hypothetical protein